MDPLISFVVPCYKLAHLLPQCINSILAQTYQNFEVLIMDNCSPDDTAGVAASFGDPRVKHIRNEINIGHVRNFNKGITMAAGKYVWLVSADDWLRTSDILGRYVGVMERNPGVGYIFCRAVEMQGSKEVGVAQWTSCGEKDRIWNGRNFLTRLIGRNFIVMSSTMVRKDCFDKVGLFPLDMPYACDWYLWCVLALHYQVAYLADAMVFVRIHEQSLSTAFSQGPTPICVVDELNVLSRVARQVELVGVASQRHAFNVAIASRAARVLEAEPSGIAKRGLSKAEFEVLLRSHMRDVRDEKDLRALVYMAIGDEQYWNGEYRRAEQSYRSGLKLRPLWLGSWAKYLLLRTGSLGDCVRRFSLEFWRR